MSVQRPSSRKYSPSASRIAYFRSRFRGFDTELIVYAAAAVVFWFIPLLNRLHVESMAALAFIAFFTSGSAAYRHFEAARDPFLRVLQGRLIRLGLPVALLSIAVLWAPNCDYLRGILFAPLFPGITVALAVCGAYLATAYRIRYRYFVLSGLAVCLAGPLFDIGFHPQFYTYNHVFGGVLGPIYDEALAVRPGLFWYRGLTLLWAALFYLAARRRHELEASMNRIGVVVVAIGLAYLISAFLGFNTPSWYLQSRLSGARTTEHFIIHFDPEKEDPSDIERWSVEHEYRYVRLRDRLGIEIDEPIHSYVYPDAATRASLTGARYTSVAPVWLSEPQVHVLSEQIENVFAHELSHVFSRAFGIPVLNASLSVGLVEGFAVATEPPDGRPTPHDMVAASALFRDSEPEELAERIAVTLSPTGFWTGRGAVSYTVSGSFVAFLLDRYGVEPFKLAYPGGSFASAYGKQTRDLAREWVEFLSNLEFLDRSAAWRAGITFSVPSLFEQTCPHWIPSEIRREEAAAKLLEEGRVEEALKRYEALLQSKPTFLAARTGWGRTMLAAAKEVALRDSLSVLPGDSLTTAELGLLADASALSGEVDSASALYEAVRGRYPAYARDSRAFWAMRQLTAPYPDMLRVLVSADSLALRRDRLASVLVEREIETTRADGIGILWQGLLAAEDSSWSDAQVALEAAMSIPDGPCSSSGILDLRLRCPAWAAVFAYRAGDFEAAMAYAESARKQSTAAGDLSFVRVMIDFQNKLNWLRINPRSVNGPNASTR